MSEEICLCKECKEKEKPYYKCGHKYVISKKQPVASSTRYQCIICGHIRIVE